MRRHLIAASGMILLTSLISLSTAETHEIIDATSLPLVITERGQYVVSGALQINEPGTHGIEIRASHVSIDFKNATLSGPGAGSGCAIFQSPEFSHLSVSNARIVNWLGPTTPLSPPTDYPDLAEEHADYFAVAVLGPSNHLVWITAETNQNGFLVGPSANLRRCRSRYASIGLVASAHSSLEFCSMHSNSDLGIFVAGASSADKCTSYSNRVGILVSSDSELTFCTTYGNQETGIRALDDSRVVRCASYENETGITAKDRVLISNCGVPGNRLDGIHAGNHCTIERCTAVNNGRYGIQVSSGNRVLTCNIHRNAKAGVMMSGADNLIVSNSMFNNATAIIDQIGGNEIAANDIIQTANSETDALHSE